MKKGQLACKGGLLAMGPSSRLKLELTSLLGEGFEVMSSKFSRGKAVVPSPT